MCFGDSNTYGYIPGGEGRYPWEVRWTGILADRLYQDGIRVVEEGLCGRTTVFEDVHQLSFKSMRKHIFYLPFATSWLHTQRCATLHISFFSSKYSSKV